MGRVELELVQVASQMADGLELIDIYVPVRALPAGNMDGQAILDEFNLRLDVPLDFRVARKDDVTSVNCYDVSADMNRRRTKVGSTASS